MSKKDALFRYHHIISKIRTKPSTFAEIQDSLNLAAEIHDYKITTSQRTFQRDLDEIRSLYNIEIAFIPAEGVYRVVSEDETDVHKRMLEAYSTYHALSFSQQLSAFIHFEKRRPQGQEHFYPLLRSIKKRSVVAFTYQKFSEDEPSQRELEPYALKEFRSRWYVIGKDMADGQIKTFGLDRISDPEMKRKKFTYPADFKVEDMFQYSFGIIATAGMKPETIVLAFHPDQANYVKSFPLHASQQELADNDKEYRISLRLCITYDLIMELLSYGPNLKVIKPLVLKKKMLDLYSAAIENMSR